MDGSKFLQFELWKDCTHNCAFCFNKPWRHLFNKQYRLENLDYAINYLKNEDLSEFSYIGYIGGEFFDGALRDKDTKDKFYELMDLTVDLINSGKMKRFQFTANLLYHTVADEGDFFGFLNYLHDKTDLSKCLLCTSYDLKYRFANEQERDNWFRYMHLIKHSAIYNKLNLHVETIPAQFFIDAVLDNSFDIRAFKKDLQCELDIADIHTGFYWNSKHDMQKELPDFFPRRQDFLKFLEKVFTEGTLTRDNICHFNSMAYTLYFPRPPEFTGANSMMTERSGKEVRLPYGHQETSDYIDSDDCMLEDIQDMWDMTR